MTPPAPAGVISRRRRFTVWTMFGVFAVGVVLQLTIRDAWEWPTAAVFYMLPRPLLTAIAVLAAWFSRRLSAREFRLATLIALCGVIWTGFADVRWAAPPAPASDQKTIRVALWNAAHLPRGIAVAAETIRGWNADIIGIVEAGTTYELELVEWQRQLPGYQMYRPRAQMLLFARGHIKPGELIALGRHSDLALAHVEMNGQSIEVGIVDIVSNIRYGRRKPLHQLVEAVQNQSTLPQIVMGDFNTPPNSVWFQPFTSGYRSAFDISGRGYCPTWPVPMPVLQLDYLWVTSGVTVHSCRHGWTMASDHRPVIADITIDTTVANSPNSFQ